MSLWKQGGTVPYREWWIHPATGAMAFSKVSLDGFIHTIEYSAYKTLQDISAEKDKEIVDLKHNEYLYEKELTALKESAKRLAECLGMVDHVGMPEPYAKNVKEALNRYKEIGNK